jgi:hypothetical protein
MKIALAVSALAQSIGFALMLTVGSLAFGQGIVYVSPQQPVYYSGIVPDTLDFPIDINGDGIADFILESRVDESCVLIPLGNNSLIGNPEPPPDLGYLVAALDSGTSIGPILALIPNAQWYNNQTDQFGNASIGGMAGFDQQIVIIGNFTGLPSAYIGFDLLESGNNYYGWIQVSNPLQFLYGNFVDWAYQSTPNIPISAGAVPEPSTWILLTIGTAFLVCPKKRK